MLSRLFTRSVRWLTASLAVAALVTALAVPVQAAPRSDTGPTISLSLDSWVHWVSVRLAGLEILSKPAAEEDDEPSRVSEASNCAVDPNGASCPEPD